MKYFRYAIDTEWFWVGAPALIAGTLLHQYAHEGVLGGVGIFLLVVGSALLGVAFFVAGERVGLDRQYAPDDIYTRKPE